jgi:putative flippase GtrA
METLKAGWAFAKENDVRTILRRFNGKDAHPLLQFVKYGFCGLLAVAIHNVVFGILSYWINPAIDDSLGDSVRAIRATANNCIAFVFSNCAAYFTNVKWVFVQGRHKPLKEFLIFSAVSSLSFGAGLLLVPFLITGFSAQTWIAQGAFVATSALVNYVSRKFFVFQR